MLKTGQPAPAFTLDTVEGKQRDLATLLERGPVALCFFKVSCPVCQYTFPFLERLHQGSGDGRLQFVGISQDGTPATEYFLHDYGVTFVTVLDTHAGGYEVSNAYGIRAVPTVIVIEPDGTISAVMEGFEKAGLEDLGERVGRAPFERGDNVPAFKPG